MGGQGGCLDWTTMLVFTKKNDHRESQTSGSVKSQGLRCVVMWPRAIYFSAVGFCFLTYKTGLIMTTWDFPGGPAVKTPSSQCRGPGFNR